MKITSIVRSDSTPMMPQSTSSAAAEDMELVQVSIQSSDGLVPFGESKCPETLQRPSGVDRQTSIAVALAQRGRKLAELKKNAKINRRLVEKTGECNVTRTNVLKRNRKFLVDIFTTLVDMKWRYHILLFVLAFVVSWCFFGLIWYAIAYRHGDVSERYDTDSQDENATWSSCVDNVYSFKTALLFSIETQHTIGYGFRVIQPVCEEAIFVMMLQSCVGLFIQSLITGIIFAKISRPKGRSQTIMFSSKAVICKRDGEYYFLFRVGDMRKSHIIGTSIRALMVKNRLTNEGEMIPLCQSPLNLETETSKSDCFVFMVWPVTVAHKIDSNSPLWELSANKLLTDHFEIIIILEGTVESTGMLTQVRTSYTPSEIVWGQRMTPLVTFQLHNGRYQINYSEFHNTMPMTMPECSAKDYAEGRYGSKELESEMDYPANFTAPAIRLGSNTTGSIHHLFKRHGSLRRRIARAKEKSNPKNELETSQTNNGQPSIRRHASLEDVGTKSKADQQTSFHRDLNRLKETKENNKHDKETKHIIDELCRYTSPLSQGLVKNDKEATRPTESQLFSASNNNTSHA